MNSGRCIFIYQPLCVSCLDGALHAHCPVPSSPGAVYIFPPVNSSPGRYSSRTAAYALSSLSCFQASNVLILCSVPSLFASSRLLFPLLLTVAIMSLTFPDSLGQFIAAHLTTHHQVSQTRTFLPLLTYQCWALNMRHTSRWQMAVQISLHNTTLE